jgi:hypothetical protein
MQLELFDWEPADEGKKCSKCAIVKPLDDFPYQGRQKDYRYPHCRACVSKRDALKYKNNKAAINKRNRTYNRNNRAACNALLAKRRARKLEATPSWLSKQHFEAIKEFYKEAKRLEDLFGELYHVDHIVPLQGAHVCGLHVPWNLQVLTASENCSKSNKLTQDCFT